jgi:hypothetical protein
VLRRPLEPGQRLVVVKRGQHQNLRVGQPIADFPGGFDAAAVHQADIHDHYVWPRALRFAHRLCHGFRLGHHADVVGRGQHSLDTAAHDLVVIDQHDAQSGHGLTVHGCHSLDASIHDALDSADQKVGVFPCNQVAALRKDMGAIG